ELRRLAHTGRGAGEGAAVPRLDDGLGARADAEAEPTGRDARVPRVRQGERLRAAGVDVRDRGADAQPRRERDDGERREAVHAVHLERPRIAEAEPLGFARELAVLGEREAVDRHRQSPPLHGALLDLLYRVTRFYCMIPAVSGRRRTMLGDVIELSVVVRDLDVAVERFTGVFGLNVHHRGE